MKNKLVVLLILLLSVFYKETFFANQELENNLNSKYSNEEVQKFALELKSINEKNNDNYNSTFLDIGSLSEDLSKKGCLSVEETAHITIMSNEKNFKNMHVLYNFLNESNYEKTEKTEKILFGLSNKLIVEYKEVKDKEKDFNMYKNLYKIDTLCLEKIKTLTSINYSDSENNILANYAEKHNLKNLNNLYLSNRLKDYLLSTDIKQYEQSAFAKELADEKNKNLFEKKRDQFNKMVFTVNELYSLDVLKKEKFKTVTLDTRLFDRGIMNVGTKIKSNDYDDLYKFFEKYISKNLNLEYIFDYINDSLVDRKKDKQSIRLDELIEIIDNSKRKISEIHKSEIKETLKQFYLSKGCEIDPREKVNVELRVEEEVKKTNFDEKLKIIKESLFNSFNFISSCDKEKSINLFKNLIIEICDFYNDKSFIEKINSKTQKKYIFDMIAVLNKISSLNGFDLDQKISGFVDEKLKKEFIDNQFLKNNDNNKKFHAWHICKEYRNFIFDSVLKTAFSDAASYIVDVSMVKDNKNEKNTFCVSQNINDEKNNFKVSFKEAHNPAIKNYDSNSVELNSKPTCLVGGNSSGKSQFLQTMLYNLIKNNVSGVVAAKEFIINGDSFNLIYKDATSNGSKGLSSFDLEKYFVESALSMEEISKKNIYFFLDEYAQNTTPELSAGFIKKQINNKFFDKFLIFISTHYEDIQDAIYDNYKDASIFSIDASVKNKNDDKSLLTSSDFVNVEKDLGFSIENYDKEKSENECIIRYKNNGKGEIILFDNQVDAPSDSYFKNILNPMYKILTISSSLNDKKFVNYLPKAIVSIEDGKYLFCEIEKKTDDKTGKFYFSPKNIKFYDKNDLKITMHQGKTIKMLNNEKALHFIGKHSPLIKELLLERMNNKVFSVIGNDSNELPCFYNGKNLQSCVEKILASKKK